MKLLLDEGLPHPAADVLRRMGFEAVHVLQVALRSADDVDIVEAARAEGQIIVTLDGDFHSIMATSGARLPSVIRIRIEGLHWDPLADLIARVVRAHQQALQAGALLSVREASVRIRRLPIKQ